MKAAVYIGPTGSSMMVRQIVRPGVRHSVSLLSPWLVSRLQEFPVTIQVDLVPDPEDVPGGALLVRSLTKTALDYPRVVSVPVSWDRCVVPSRRTLKEILDDVVRHGRNYPTHGANCICMDEYIREVRAHVNAAAPPLATVPDNRREEWAQAFNARMRISHVLQTVRRVL